jgi:hypothetical protein
MLRRVDLTTAGIWTTRLLTALRTDSLLERQAQLPQEGLSGGAVWILVMNG